MCLDDDRVGESREQLRQRVEMVGRFQDPLFGRIARLKVLEKALLPSICEAESLRTQESSLRGWNSAVEMNSSDKSV